MAHPTRDASVPDIQVERLRWHQRVLWSSLLSAAMLALILASLLQPPLGWPALVPWLAALGLALGGRWYVARAQRRAGPSADADAARWLGRHRLAYFLHGAVWGGAVLAYAWRLEREPLNVLTLALLVLIGGSLVAGAYDRRAAMLFALPAGAPLLLRLLGAGAPPEYAQALIGVMFVAVMNVVARRTESAVISATAARLASARQACEAEQARAALAEQHRMFGQLLDGTAQGYWYIDTDGRTLDVNPAMCALLGRTREHLLGRAARDFFHPDDLPTLDRELAARAAGQGGAYEVALLRPDGTRVLCRNVATPVYDAEGRRIGSVGLWTDLTERIETERRLRTHELVVRSMNEIVAVVDEAGRYRFVNDAWCRTLGRPRDQVLGRTATELAGGQPDPRRLAALRECIETQRPTTLRASVRSELNRDAVFETTYAPYRDAAADLRCVVMVSRDVSDEVRAQQQLAELAADLERTLEATGDAIFASDADDPRTPVRFANQRMRRMWGLPEDPALPLTPADIMVAARPLLRHPEREEEQIRQIVAGNLQDESRLELRDGRVLLRRCMPAPGSRGTVRVWSFRDITAEHRALVALRASEAEQRALLDAFPGWIGALDHRLHYHHVNERLAALHDRVPEEMVERALRDLYPEDRCRLIESEVREARTNGRARGERSFPAAPGRPRLDLEIIHVLGAPRPDGTQLVYGFGLDITARKAAEEALIRARDAAEQANRAKSQFLAHMSHELRTPLNAVLGFAQLLAADAGDALTPGQQAQLREIDAGGRHLLELINEMLDLGRIESGQLVTEDRAVALAPLADECLGLVRSLAQGSGLRLAPPPALPDGAAVRGDRMRIKQVLLNLLGNAVKYNRPGGEVELLCEPADAGWRIVVRDTGRGLDAGQQARLFTPFERLGAAAEGIEGTGIGLALSRRLVEAMRGTIGVQSEPGVGSRFWFALPRAEASAPAPALPRPPGPRRVLYIEDNPVNVILMEAMLARLPQVQLQTASHPVEGLRMAQRDPPHLVLLDIQLPGMDGYEVFARLRAEEATRQVPVAAVSADGLPGSIDAALAAGFAAYLTKPLDLEQLLATVQRLLAEPVTAAA